MPVVSSRRHGWAYLFTESISFSEDGELSQNYGFNAALAQGSSRYRLRFATGGGVGACTQARRVPLVIRREFRIRCVNGPGCGDCAGISGPPPVRPSRRLIADLNTDILRRPKSVTGTLGAARSRFGVGTASQVDDVCQVAWTRRGVTAKTFQFRHPGADPCANDAQIIDLTVTKEGWYTDRGLTLGTPAKTLRRLYPSAEMPNWSPGIYQLGPIRVSRPDRRSRAIFGRIGMTELRNGLFLMATMSNGRVAALTLHNDIGD